MKNPYRGGDDILVIKVESCTGKRLSQFKTSTNDSVTIEKVLNAIIEKYGLPIKVIREKKDWIKADEEFQW